MKYGTVFSVYSMYIILINIVFILYSIFLDRFLRMARYVAESA